MSEAVVSDSTCLVGLERVGELNILPALFDSVMLIFYDKKAMGFFESMKNEE